MKKVLLCSLIVLCLCLLLPREAAAEQISGTCGENVTRTLSNDGALTVSGERLMTDYSINSAPPGTMTIIKLLE